MPCSTCKLEPQIPKSHESWPYLNHQHQLESDPSISTCIRACKSRGSIRPLCSCMSCTHCSSKEDIPARDRALCDPRASICRRSPVRFLRRCWAASLDVSVVWLFAFPCRSPTRMSENQLSIQESMDGTIICSGQIAALQTPQETSTCCVAGEFS